ncbi:hypothetical protein SAMN04488020_101487 [Palleronia marisminoris]|uniref:Chromosome partition protein Smc n=1 Tax=Palleronia marisminoris TaxID=315423 RepID=A0A1Y5RH65_9RHOB|nr:hypothetical protein [Palleronia marisminoris]SFG20001.1 hypothetical protein SAMN04488020_101487 [Palleronia marisminoris]SLN17294.1 hypothetical protein PAM7066_00487 [Palleronia marisminoris]
MQDINELHQRLAAALDRIEADVEQLARPRPEPVAEPEPEPQGPDAAQLESDLAAERELVQQLEERLKSTRDRYEARVTAAESELETAHALLAELEEDRGRLKVVADGLRESCEALRQTDAPDGELINTAMAAEIEALATMRRSDRSELDTVLALFATSAQSEDESDA